MTADPFIRHLQDTSVYVPQDGDTGTFITVLEALYGGLWMLAGMVSAAAVIGVAFATKGGVL